MATHEYYGGQILPYAVEVISNGFVLTDDCTRGNMAGATRLYFPNILEVWKFIRSEVDKEIEKAVKESREKE